MSLLAGPHSLLMHQVLDPSPVHWPVLVRASFPVYLSLAIYNIQYNTGQKFTRPHMHTLIHTNVQVHRMKPYFIIERFIFVRSTMFVCLGLGLGCLCFSVLVSISFSFSVTRILVCLRGCVAACVCCQLAVSTIMSKAVTSHSPFFILFCSFLSFDFL